MEQLEYVLTIYFYVQGKYKGNNFPDKTIKNDKLVSCFILAIKICANCLNSQHFVNVITILFKLLCQICRVKQAIMLHFATLSALIEFNRMH